ncbi:glycosyltransferase [Candidatus Omnitrophus magneticus]|uniref:Glycosyltransferase n=1 Tax=Candidatus Omnitrophus magneticus TaxID=1609969 RepID=A0A0F0CTB0_9BACT|nr:glycosyltransferase [Candidatus Omnitrophus magneticus]KJJ84871.1 glycosyltransferase [Candidatus Omnitrophus magneticus]
MKILIVKDRNSAGGGIVNYYNALKKYFTLNIKFNDVGRPFSFYSGKMKLSAIIEKITAVRLLSDYIKLIWNIITFHPDIVHLNVTLDKSKKALKREAVNIFIAKLFARKIIVFWRGWYYEYSGKPEFPCGNNSFIYKQFSKSDTFIVLSNSFKEDLLRWGFKAPIFIETTTFDSSIGDPAENKKQIAYDISAKAKKILFLSRVKIEKGVLELLDAYKILKTKDSDYKLTIVGDGPHLEIAKKYAKEKNINNVTFAGLVTGIHRREYYKECGIFCLPSYTEGMPNTVLEAMAMGLIIIASDVGGLKDILLNNKTGFILKKYDEMENGKKFNPNEIAQKILEISCNKKLLEEISSNNKKYAMNHFHPAEVTKRLEKIYAQTA